MERKTAYWLIAIVLLTLGGRILFAITPNFTYETYFHLRQVEQITQTGLPLYEDSLSYGGRGLTFLPLFHYLVAFFALIIPLEIAAMILPNLFLALLPIIVYLLSKTITNHEQGSLFAAFISGFLPILFLTANSFTVKMLFIPLAFLTIYAFLRVDEKKYLYLFVGSFLLCSLTSSATFLIVMGFILYLLLSVMEGKKINRNELELILFTLFFFVWTQFIFFKNVFMREGLSFVWQNIPRAIVMEYFPQISILKAIVLVSVIPFIAGIFIVYQALFRLQSARSFLLISLAISTSILSWLRLIEFQLSLMFFAVILAVFFASFYEHVQKYLIKTKIARHHHWLPYLTIILLLPSMLYPAAATATQQNIPSEAEITAFVWLSEHTPPQAGVLALLEEGHLVTYFAQRRNMIDDQFALISDVEERFKDLNILYRTTLQTQAIGLLDQYDLQYLVLTTNAQKKVGGNTFNYLSKKCFELVYNEVDADEKGAQIYRVRCTIRTRK